MPLVVQELSGGLEFTVFYNFMCGVLLFVVCPFVPILLTIVLSVLLSFVLLAIVLSVLLSFVLLSFVLLATVLPVLLRFMKRD